MSAGAFETLRARAALTGVQLLRSDPQDGAVRLLALVRGAWRELRTVEDVESLVVQTAASTTAGESTA